MEKKNNKILIKNIINISIVITLSVILIILFEKVYKDFLNAKKYESSIISFAERNQKTIFKIDKIILFSSCNSKESIITENKYNMKNLYTYTDIALFINNNKENTAENTLKQLKISNIKITKKTSIGEQQIYYKSINNFAKSEIEESYKIDKELEYQITAEDEANLEEPILYNNCANPITLSYVNQNLKTDCIITDIDKPIVYDGSLLKRCGIMLSTIEASISFDIFIENNKGQKFKTTIYLDMPYDESGKSIYDGNLTVKKDTEFKFYRYE